MKKVMIFSAIIVIGAVSGFTIANNKVEEKISEAITQSNNENKDVVVKTNVSANVLTGKLTFTDIDIKYYGNHLTDGKVIVDGIKFYDNENMFSNNIKVELNDFIIEQKGIKYVSDNSIEIKNNPENGDLTMFTKSEFVDQKDSSYKMVQSLDIKLAKTQNVYEDLTKAFTTKAKDENANLQTMTPVLLEKLSMSIVKSINLGFANDKMVQRSVRNDLISKFPNAKEEEMDKYIVYQLDNELNKLPTIWHEPLKRVMLNPSSTISIDIQSKNDITLNYIYMEMLSGKSIQDTLIKNYEIIIK